MTSPNTVILKANGLSQRADEAVAVGTITPGDFIKHDVNGKVLRHATAGGGGEMMFAKEDTFQGKTIDNDYVATDRVFIHRAQKGDEIYAWVAANAAAIVVNDDLTPDGTGGWKKATAGSQSGTTPFAVTFADTVLAKAIEALDNSAVAARARLRVRVL